MSSPSQPSSAPQVDPSPVAERIAALKSRMAEYGLVSVVVLIIAGIEISRWLLNTPPNPLLYSILAAGLTGYAAVRIGFILPQLRALRRQHDAQAALQRAISGICSRGYVFFDAVSDARGHRIGPVLAGPGGVFTLTFRHMEHGNDVLETVHHINRTTVRVGDHEIMADPLGNARQAASLLYQLLGEHGLHTMPVQPVLIFPGWQIGKPPAEDEREVWVVNEVSLAEEILRQPHQGEPRELISVSELLQRHAGLLRTRTMPVPPL